MSSNVIHVLYKNGLMQQVTCANAGEAQSIVVSITEALWQNMPFVSIESIDTAMVIIAAEIVSVSLGYVTTAEQQVPLPQPRPRPQPVERPAGRTLVAN